MKNNELALLPQGYDNLLNALKARVHKARMSAALAANAELVSLYIDIGKAILERRNAEGWGAKVIERLAKDFRTAFPDMKVFSPKNFSSLHKTAKSCVKTTSLQQVAAKSS